MNDFPATFWGFEKALPEIPPVLPFAKGGELSGIPWRIRSIFSPLEKGRKKGILWLFKRLSCYVFSKRSRIAGEDDFFS
jgi:hypothetical protein